MVSVLHQQPHQSIEQQYVRHQLHALGLACCYNITICKRLGAAVAATVYAATSSPCQSWKPFPSSYQFAVKQLGVSADRVCMVASHPWDIAGAMQVWLAVLIMTDEDQ